MVSQIVPENGIFVISLVKTMPDDWFFNLENAPLIVTARMDDRSFTFFNELTRLHFPPERKYLSAHITLFHRLPGAEVSQVSDDIKNITTESDPPNLDFQKWRFLGRGVAMAVDSPSLVEMRNGLAHRWADHLTLQDRQKYNPHITIQNKVEPAAAKKLL